MSRRRRKGWTEGWPESRYRPPDESNNKNTQLRLKVWTRDGRRCCYCQDPLAFEHATLDHIIPASKGGPTNELNCICSCQRCNNEKGDMSAVDFIEYQQVLREIKAVVSPLMQERLGRFLRRRHLHEWDGLPTWSDDDEA